MPGVFRVGMCISASALALVMALSASVETQEAVVTDAPVGFDTTSNGFAEEFCANQEKSGELARGRR